MSWEVFTLGIPQQELPGHPDITWRSEPTPDCNALLIDGELYGQQRPDVMDELSQVLSPLLPVAVVGPRLGAGDGADYIVPVMGAEALPGMLHALAPIRARIEELPERDYRAHHDFLQLAILAMSYTREQPITAARTPSDPTTIVYPLLQARPGFMEIQPRVSLENLANLELLERKFFNRVLVCPTCESGRLSAYEACVVCGSSHLVEETIVHHYRCGFQDGESRFAHHAPSGATRLICPKCQTELRHFGVDYGRPGTLMRCLDCSNVMSEPQPTFICLDCRAVTAGDAVNSADWHHYGMTDRGAMLLHARAPSDVNLEALSQALMRADPVKDFVLLVREQILVANRYQRPVVLARVGIVDRPYLGERPMVTGETPHIVTKVITENFRETDVVTSLGDDTLIIAMPETTRAQAEVLFDRIRRNVAKSVSVPVELRFETYERDEALAVLDSLAP